MTISPRSGTEGFCDDDRSAGVLAGWPGAVPAPSVGRGRRSEGCMNPYGDIIQEHFRNPHNRQLEGTFEYPLPTGASPSYYAMFLGQTRDSIPARFRALR